MSKLHFNGLPPVAARTDAANAFTLRQSFPAAVAGGSSINITPGVDPTVPVDGDSWIAGAALKFHLSGVTKSVVFQGDFIAWVNISANSADIIATLGYTPGVSLTTADEAVLLTYVM